MRRREFIMLVGGAAASLPVAASAQERMRRIGMLVHLAEGDAEGEAWVQAFLQGMQALGWQRDTNFQIEIRWGANNLDRIAGFAKELVALQPDLIQTTTTLTTAAILRETHDIAVVFADVADPVGSGFVPPNLAHPGGNVTGFSNWDASLGSKWVQLLKEIAPAVSRVAMLFNPDTGPYIVPYFWGAIESESKTLGIAAQVAPFRDVAGIEPIITALGPQAGLIVMPDTSNVTHRKTIISLAALHHVAAIYGFRFFAHDGGLVSYGVDIPELLRRSAAYADRILKGAKPGDLPVQLPNKFELVINLKTVKALDLNVPNTLLAAADELIE